MKALVLYRSFHGNTKLVAETIASRLKEKGYETRVQDVRQKLPELTQIDLIVNGAPTRIKSVNRRSVSVLRELKMKGISGKPIGIYDTCAIIPTNPVELEKSRKWLIPGAAGIMHKVATELGMNVYGETLRCEVKDMKGPLTDNALQKAIEFTDAFVASAQRK